MTSNVRVAEHADYPELVQIWHDGRHDAHAEIVPADMTRVRHNEVLRRACCIGRTDRVLDIGCGAGQTTREAARAASTGTAAGVDISAAMIQRARRLAKAEGLRNVKFIQADAETYRFPSEMVDIAISRFGTMFFHDPVRAFTNVARTAPRWPAGDDRMAEWQAQ